MKKKVHQILSMVLVFIMILSVVETSVPANVQAKSKTTTVNKTITLTTSKTISTKYTIKSVKSSNSSILSVKKVSSKKFKVTSKYKYGSAVITVRFKNGKTTKYKYDVGKYSLKKGKGKTVSTKYTIKSVKSDKTKIASVKKTSSKRFKVTAKKAGAARITVTFKNRKKANYYFKVTGSSSSGNNNNDNNNNSNNNNEKVSLSKTSLTMNEGDTTTLTVSISSLYDNQALVYWESSNTSVATVSSSFTDLKEMKKGTIKAVGGGTATITAVCMLNTEDILISCTIKVNESKKSASVYGFTIIAYSNKSTFKVKECDSRNTDGTNTYDVDFFCNGSEYWINKNVTFEVEDVTPKAYAKMYLDMGIKYQAPSLKKESSASALREWNAKEGQVNWSPIKIQEPFTNAGPGQDKIRATAGKRLVIDTGMSTRALKVVAKQGDKVLDYVYLTSNSRNKNDSSSYSKYDLDLYRAVLNKVEEALWKPGMINSEKLIALNNYINSTNHYPGRDLTLKEYNATFWENWSVDDTYIMKTDSILDNIMMFQGGICDCWAAQVLMKIAMEDLGIPKIKDMTEDGEGVWLGMGSNSSNPTAPTHVTMFYKDSEGTCYGFDVNGMTYNHSEKEVTCEVHQCREKLIPLK